MKAGTEVAKGRLTAPLDAAPLGVRVAGPRQAGLSALSAALNARPAVARLAALRPPRQMMGRVPVNDDAGLEREASVMGAKALQHTGHVVGPLASGVADTHSVQLFTDHQVNARVESDQAPDETLEQKQRKAIKALILEDYPGADAELVLETARALLVRYAEGETLERDEYKAMAKGVSEDALAEAAEARKSKIGYDPATEKLQQGERSWANSAMNQGINDLRKQMPQFTTGHHKVSKSKLGAVVELMSSEQHSKARTLLDLAPGFGTTAFKSLGSNVSSGPNSGLRLDERNRRLDANFDKSGASTPRSQVLGELDLLLDKILSAHQGVEGFLGGEEYDELLSLLSQAEKIHNQKTSGKPFDDDVTMWLEIPTEPGRLSHWVKKSVPSAFIVDAEKLKGVSVRETKALQYQVVVKPSVTPIPALFAGRWHYLGGSLTVDRAKHASTMGIASEEGKAAWAKAGYKTEQSGQMVTRTRIDPPELRLSFAEHLNKFASATDAGPIREAFDHLTRVIEEAGHKNTDRFDLMSGAVVDECKLIQTAIGKIHIEGGEANAAQVFAISLVDLVKWFAEGSESLEANNAQIQATLNAISH